MSISLRIPPEKEKLIHKAAKKSGITKTAIILEAVDEKLGLTQNPGTIDSRISRLAHPRRSLRIKAIT